MSDLKFDGADYIQFAVILINTLEGSDKINVQILKFKNKNRWPNLGRKQILSHKSFNVFADFAVYVPNMKFYLLEAILEIFPKCLYHNGKTMLWDYNIDLTKIEGKILNKLSDNPYFNNPVEKLPEKFGFSGRGIFYISEHPLHRWAFNMINKKSEITLENITCNRIANLFMKKVFEIAKNEETDFLNISKIDANQTKKLISNMNPINIILFLNREKIPKFKEIYQRQMKCLILPNRCYDLLESYFPKDFDFISVHDLSTCVLMRDLRF